MRSANCNEPLYRDGQGHVGGVAEGHGRHGVEEVHIHLGEKLRFRKHVTDKLKSGICMHRDIEDDKPEKEFLKIGRD